MSESEIRKELRSMTKNDLMILLAGYLLLEQGIEVTSREQLDEVIEQNYMKEVARQDLTIEIINSKVRLGLV